MMRDDQNGCLARATGAWFEWIYRGQELSMVLGDTTIASADHTLSVLLSESV